MSRAVPLVVLVLLAVGASVADGEDGPPNDPAKAGYHLFDPTPRALMRDVRADRPSKADTPYTVDAGHVMFETSVAEGYLDRFDPENERRHVRAVNVLPTKVRVGLWRDLEVQGFLDPLVLQAWTDAKTGTRQKEVGPNGGMVALKLNLYGNDGGPFAIAVMPFADLPSITHPIETGTGERATERVEGGLRVPFEIQTPVGIDIEAHVEGDAVWNGKQKRYDGEALVAVTLEYEDLVGRFTPYVEGFAQAQIGGRKAELEITIDVGFLWKLTDDFQLDGGANFGVTERAPDVVGFLGFAIRL